MLYWSILDVACIIQTLARCNSVSNLSVSVCLYSSEQMVSVFVPCSIIVRCNFEHQWKTIT